MLLERKRRVSVRHEQGGVCLHPERPSLYADHEVEEPSRVLAGKEDCKPRQDHAYEGNDHQEEEHDVVRNGEQVTGMAHFDDETVSRFATSEEIEIEAGAGAYDAPVRTPIWTVTVGADVYVRAIRGTKGKWYRSVTSARSPTVVLGGSRLPVRPVVVRDRSEIDRVTKAYQEKYATSQWLGSVLKPHTLEATLRLEPA